MLDPAWIALIGTVSGTVGLKVVEHYLARNQVRVDDAQQIRDELRIEINSQRDEIRQLEEDVDRWREQYYKLRDMYVELKTELTLALQKIKDEAAEAEIKAGDTHLPPLNPPIDLSPPNVVD